MSDTLDEIRKLYFGATKATIARDFDRAIDLLKSMESEDERERAVVFMQGLAEMKKEWGRRRAKTKHSAKTAQPMMIFLRAAMRSGSGTLRLVEMPLRSFSFRRLSRLSVIASGVFEFFTSDMITP